MMDSAASAGAIVSLPGEFVDGQGRFRDPPIVDTLDGLLSIHGRERLRELAEHMKDSGALRIKDHRTIQGFYPNTFKGEYVFLLSHCRSKFSVFVLHNGITAYWSEFVFMLRCPSPYYPGYLLRESQSFPRVD
jgi:hypothetical protein